MDQLVSLGLWGRLLLAVACGAAIGLERELSDKPAGLRTNMLICVGSTLITMVSIHVATTLGPSVGAAPDPGRIAAQIVTGIGFLGAGSILQARGAVHGLTTAATIWALAGIGLAIGSGAFGLAIGTTLLLLAILLVLGRVAKRLSHDRAHFALRIHARRADGLLARLESGAADRDLEVQEIEILREPPGVVVVLRAAGALPSRQAFVESLLADEVVESVRLST